MAVLLLLNAVFAVAFSYELYKFSNKSSVESTVMTQYVLFFSGCLLCAFTLFMEYLLFDTVRLLRRFSNELSHGSNERTALLHIVMVFSLFIG